MRKSIPSNTFLTDCSVSSSSITLFLSLETFILFRPQGICAWYFLFLFFHSFTSGLYSFWCKYLKIVSLYHHAQHYTLLYSAFYSFLACSIVWHYIIYLFIYFFLFIMSPPDGPQTPSGQGLLWLVHYYVLLCLKLCWI